MSQTENHKTVQQLLTHTLNGGAGQHTGRFDSVQKFHQLGESDDELDHREQAETSRCDNSGLEASWEQHNEESVSHSPEGLSQCLHNAVAENQVKELVFFVQENLGVEKTT